MNLGFEEMRYVVRSGGEESASFEALRSIGQKYLPRYKWGKVVLPRLFKTDVLEACRWLTEVVTPFRPTNVYLALDAINEYDGLGKNVDSGMTRVIDQDFKLHGWEVRSWEGPRERHLLWGLLELHKCYLKWDLEYPANVLVDYVLFMGYAGLVYATAVERAALTFDCRFLWGFGEDAPFPLIRTSNAGVVRL